MSKIRENLANQKEYLSVADMARQVMEQKEGKKLAHEELLLSRCYSELATLSIDENNKMKALSFQLERLKLIEDTKSLASEKFDVRYSIAEIYLDSRLKEQFDREILALEALSQNAEDLDRINDLRKRFEEVNDFDDQDQTGRIEFATTP